MIKIASSDEIKLFLPSLIVSANGVITLMMIAVLTHRNSVTLTYCEAAALDSYGCFSKSLINLRIIGTIELKVVITRDVASVLILRAR